MRTITVKLEDELAEALDQWLGEGGFASKSELVREAIRHWMILKRKEQLQVSLARYLRDKPSLRQAADDVESRRAITEEALARAE